MSINHKCWSSIMNGVKRGSQRIELTRFKADHSKAWMQVKVGEKVSLTKPLTNFIQTNCYDKRSRASCWAISLFSCFSLLLVVLQKEIGQQCFPERHVKLNITNYSMHFAAAIFVLPPPTDEWMRANQECELSIAHEYFIIFVFIFIPCF